MSLGIVTQEEDVKGVHGKDLIFFLQSELALMALFSKHEMLINCPVLIHLIAPMFDLFCCLIREW